MRFLSLLLLLLPAFALADPVSTKHVTADLIAEYESFKSGSGTVEEGANRVGLRLEMIPHWHTYWSFPGDSGLPTEIVWTLPAGWSAGEPQWPLPKRIFVPPLVNYGYEGEALIGIPLRIPANTAGEFTIKAHVSWLVCKEECVPEKVDLSLRVKVGKERGKPGLLADAFKKLERVQPQKGKNTAAEVVYKDNLLGLSFQHTASGAYFGAKEKLDFFPKAPMIVKGEAPPKVERRNDRTILWLEKADPFDAKAASLPGIVVSRSEGAGTENVTTVELELKPAVAAAAALPPQEPASPFLLVLFAFLGGLILNLMPCVFPVLGIKVMSLVRQGGGDKMHARLHGKTYAAGVVVCFWVLAGVLVALRSAGQSVGWGFQLQQPLFVTTLILLFSFVAADLAGFIHWSGRWMGAGSGLADKEGYAGSFFTGVLAVIVATPCSAPFMGTAIGAAIGESGWVIFLVFTSLGLGLALPFVLLCYQPAYLKLLPKPGAWMERLKELFAFPIVATVLWLLWVLTLQIGADGVLKVELGLLVMMISVWVRRRFSASSTQVISYLLLLAGVLICAWGAKTAPVGSGEAQGPWKPYNEQVLEEALDAGKPVFVDFTAAWCLTCQVNKRLVLDRADLQNFFREKGVLLLLADWTTHDPAITKALERQGRIGVPVYLAFRAGSRKAEILPQILTEDRIRSLYP